MSRSSRSILLAVAAAFAIGVNSNVAASRAEDFRPTFRVGVETVFVNVSVTDLFNRYITGLEKYDFRILEDSIEQTITHFVEESAPISVGILLDVSGSMRDNLKTARTAVAGILKSANPEDEFFLVSFNQRPKLVQGFTHQVSLFQHGISSVKAGGRTALYDAVHLGMEQIQGGKNKKKALILISDGEDNSSRYSATEIHELAKECSAQIYAIGDKGSLKFGRSEIQNLADVTGGRAFFPRNMSELDYYIDLIHAELSNQYILGYTPTNKTPDGKWRKLKIKLNSLPGFSRLIVSARQGYFAAKAGS